MRHKRLVVATLVLVLLFGVIIQSTASQEGLYLKEAEALKPIGVFQGTDEGFELDREPTRLEGLIMLIRMLGKEEEAQLLKDEPGYFTDIPEWGIGYGNYAYKNGLALGVGEGLYDAIEPMNAQAYMTLMLRALGYDDSKGDFKYSKSLEFANQQKIINSEDLLELKSEVFLRDHVAKVTMLTLKSNLKDKDITLLEQLVIEGVIAEDVGEGLIKIDEDLEIHFIDIGQADAILIKSGNKSMLIDAGDNKHEKLIVDYIKEQNIERLEYVIATHPHADHIGGIDAVIDNFEIGKVIMPNVTHTTKTFEDVLDSMENKGLKGTIAKAGDEYFLNGLQFTILAPNAEKYSNLNNYSVVVKLVHGDNSFLFTGDAEAISEREMIENQKEHLKVDLLNVGHHGSTTSTTQEFLDLVDPKYAVIQVGEDNKYKHPEDEVLNRLKDKNIEIYRTDLHGTIIAISDGKDIIFINEK